MAPVLVSTKVWSIFVGCAMAAIVLVFLSSTLFMGSSLSSTWQALSVASSGAPSVRQIAAARTHLREESEAAPAYVFRGGGARALSDLREARVRLREALTEEARTADHPYEKEFQDQVRLALAQLDRAADHLHPERGVAAAPLHYLAFQAAVDRVDGQLALLEEYDASFLQRDADAILAKQRSAGRLILSLDTMCVVLGALVTIIVVLFLRDHLELLGRRNRELELFSSRVAHDLMSPLATVGLALDAAGHNQAATAARAALRRARGVAEALLAFARSGGEPESGASADVADVLEGVVADARAQAADIEITLRAVGPCGEVACAPGVLTVLTSNLLCNAIKFMGESRERRVDVIMRCTGRFVRVEVSDTGPGFPSGFERVMFNPYARASAHAPGLGLGLATVKRLAEAHGGQVAVERREGGGTLFWFELPAVRPAPALVEQTT